MQHYAHSGQTGVIRVAGMEQEGSIYITMGLITHAETATSAGEEAFFEILSWQNAPYRFHRKETHNPLTIGNKVEELLVEHIRRQSSEMMLKAHSPEKAQQDRHACETRKVETNSLKILSLTIDGPEIETTRRILTPGRVTVGRGIESDLCLADSSVSRHHASLIVSPTKILVRDLGSTNGTRLDGEIIAQAIAGDGHVISFGEVHCTLSVGTLSRP